MKVLKNVFIICSIILFTLACSSKEEHAHHDHEHNGKDHSHSHELVRTGVIDVESIDLNKDGKIYECPMDWNVLGDQKGDCPTCGMHLKEYTLAEVKANLDKYGYTYKN